MAEEKNSTTEFYFYKDLDQAFLNVITSVNEDRANRGKVFANVMYIVKQDGNKDVVVFTATSNDEDEKQQLIFDRDQVRRNRQLASKGLKRVYSIRNLPDSEVEQIYFGQVFDGAIPVEPLNNAYQGSRTLSNFMNLSTYKNCDNLECIRQKPKCDNKSLFVDNAIKFSKESDKPNTNMFCRQYGVDEIADELNKIANYDQFIARLENEYKVNFVIASDVETKLRNVGSNDTQQHLIRYRLKSVVLSEDEKKTAREIADNLDNFEIFAVRMEGLLFSADANTRISGNNIKNYYKYAGSSQLKEFTNMLEERINNFYIKQRDSMVAVSRQNPSIVEMTFAIGQKITTQITETVRSTGRSIKDICRRISPYSERIMRGGERIVRSGDRMVRRGMEYVRQRRNQQPILPAGPRNLEEEEHY